MRERRAAVTKLEGIDLGAARDQHSRDIYGTAVRTIMKGSEVLVVAHVRRHAEVQQRFGNIRATSTNS
jgi:hypothetical protein